MGFWGIVAYNEFAWVVGSLTWVWLLRKLRLREFNFGFGFFFFFYFWFWFSLLAGQGADLSLCVVRLGLGRFGVGF